LESIRQLILGSVFNNNGNESRARECYIAAIKQGESGPDQHAAAFASYELGMILCKKDEVIIIMTAIFVNNFPT